jgi:hypothetical protein
VIGGRELYKRYGDPVAHTGMILWTVPDELRRGPIPKRIYCHKDMVLLLTHAFCNLLTTGYIDELQTWDGCHNIRPIRGYEKAFDNLMHAHNIEEAMDLYSIHSWGYAVDVNAATNRLGQIPSLSAGFVKCFTDAGFEWGGEWKRKDGMHFQARAFPA